MRSSSGSWPTLDIDLPADRRLRSAVAAGTLLGIGGLLGSALPLSLVALGTVPVAGVAWHSLRAAGGRHGPCRLVIDGQGRWRVGFARAGDLVPAAPVHWWCIPRAAAGLRLRVGDGRAVDLLLFRDRFDAGVWRRLTVCLRLGTRSGPADPLADLPGEGPDRRQFT